LNLTARAATIATLLLVVLCSSPREARAQYLITPFVGGAFARQTTFFTGTGFEQGEGSTHVIFGGAAGWLSSGILGFEGEFAYSPHFFEGDDPLDIILGSYILTATGNVIVTVPLSVSEYSLRPYVIGGLGLTRSAVSYLGTVDPVDDNSMAFNVGAGAIGFLTPRTGVRFELRHFRTFDREPSEVSADVSSKLSFWRATVGVVIRR
jgi:opacity protein-like surface antigen